MDIKKRKHSKLSGGDLIGHSEKNSYEHKIIRVVKLKGSTIPKVIWNIII